MADITVIQVFKGPFVCYRSAQKTFIYCRFLEGVHGATEKAYEGN